MRKPSFLERLYHQHHWTADHASTVMLQDGGVEAQGFTCLTSWCLARKTEPLPEASDPFPVVGRMNEKWDPKLVGRGFMRNSKGEPVARKRPDRGDPRGAMMNDYD